MTRFWRIPPALFFVATVLSFLVAGEPRTIKAHVVVLDQPIMVNRLGSTIPGAMIYALREDVVPFDAEMDDNGFDVADPNAVLSPGNVRLRSHKRPRPLVLRANKGDILEITFTNCLTTDPNNRAGNPLPSSLQNTVRQVGLHIAGLEVLGIESLSSYSGANPNSFAQPGTFGQDHVTPTGKAAPGETCIYRYFAKEEGAFMMYSEADTNQIDLGLFGMCNVQPETAEWYRSQVTHDDLALATMTANHLKSQGGLLEPVLNADGAQKHDNAGNALWQWQRFDPSTKKQTSSHVILKQDKVHTPQGQPLINYQAQYPAGHPWEGRPILNMLDQNNRIVHTDLTAIITGPNAGRFSYSHNSPSFYENPASPDRRQPYREITVIYHFPLGKIVQGFEPFVDPALSNAYGAGKDNFAVNYGIAGIGPEILASRLGVGPMGGEESVDLKYEEFFLSAWAVGDPAMIVDVPANTPNQVVSNPEYGVKLNANADAVVTDADYQSLGGAKATMAFYPDDPSNVYHSYMRDHVKFRIANAGSVAPHVHHQHAHQWLHSPNDDNGHYLDSQLIVPGATFTLEMVYNGSGNRNQTVGDSIFHCHFYPHFAAGMWGMWRVHDVFEEGTIVDGEGRVVWQDESGRRINNRALPDGEIQSGTPIPAVVPMPTIGMAPMPAPIRLSQDGTRVLPSNPFPQFKRQPDASDNPGFPFFIPGVAGFRGPHPPMDFAWKQDEAGNPVLDEQGDKILLDGGLPRHLVFGGDIVREFHTRWDFTRDFVIYDDEDKSNPDRKAIAGALYAYQLPEEGTRMERAAMAAHATRTHSSYTPEGRPGNFTLNGLPPVHGAPYADPSVDDQGNSHSVLRRYQGANIQMDVVFNKSGWHYPQQRLITLWKDVASTISGERPPEPFFFRAHTGETIEYWHTNLVPNYYEMDDFQVRTPTDILGQHIHLVKFDVTASDGAANGFNYEDGTFSPDEVRERIDAINLVGGLYGYSPFSQKPNLSKQTLLTVEDYQENYSFFGPAPPHQNWDGAQTTIQRWDTDPLLNNLGEDRTLRTVFTHDHFGPSTHQQTGLYAGLLVEPEQSSWFTNAPIWGGDESGASVKYDVNTQMGGRSDGGPTSWQAVIQSGVNDGSGSYREFALSFQDTALSYGPDSIGEPALPTTPLFTIPTYNSGGSGGTNLATAYWWPEAAVVTQIIDGLNQGDINDQLRQQFSRNGYDLTDRAMLITTTAGSAWEIQDTQVSDPLITDDIIYNKFTLTHNDALACSNESAGSANGLEVHTTTMHEGWADATNALKPPSDSNHPSAAPYPTLISGGKQGTQTVNYRNEPVPSRVETLTADNTNYNPDPSPHAADLAYGLSSISRSNNLLNQQPDDGRAISTSNSFSFPKHPLVPTGDAPGEVRAEDPYTPTMRAFEGDSVQIRTLVGAHTDSAHAFRLNGLKWLFEPSSDNSGWRNVQSMGISEHFEMLFDLPASTNSGMRESAFTDYLYQASSDDLGITNGIWGLLRAYDGAATDVDIPKLSDNPAGDTSEYDWQAVKDAFHEDHTTWPDHYRRFVIKASVETIAFNTRGQTLTNDPFTHDDTEITNQTGLVYTLESQTTNQGTTTYSYDNAPLILRAAAGDHIEVVLINDFDTSNWPASSNAQAPFGTGPVAAVSLNVSSSVGINAALLASDVADSTGYNIGLNPFQTADARGDEKHYYWYAGSLNNYNGVILPTPVEFGTVHLLPADGILQPLTGLVGALVVEPYGSSWNVDDHEPWSATVMDAAGHPLFRDFVAIYQGGITISTGSNAYNYRSEPQSYRVAGDTSTADNFSNSIVGGQDPQIPIFRAPAGMPFRIRHLAPGSSNDAVIVLEGHGWQEEPFIEGSSAIGHNSKSQFLGSQQIYSNEPLNMVFDAAGGTFHTAGDYRLYPYGGNAANGAWALVRVEEEVVTVEAADIDRDGTLNLQGRLMAPERRSGKVTLTFHSDQGMLTTDVAVDRQSGKWHYTTVDPRCQSGDMITISTPTGACVERTLRSAPPQ